jgi:hypothetical protein
MSKKLLNETQIRRFMELADLPTLNEMGVYGDREEEGGDPVGDMPPGPDDMGMPPEEDVPAPDMEPDADGEVVLSSEDAQKVADALPAMEKIAAAVVGEEPGMEPEMDPGMDPGPEGEVPGGLDADAAAEDELMEALRSENIDLLDENELINTVITRVAQRLVNESRRQKRDKKLETMAERIASKIVSGK